MKYHIIYIFNKLPLMLTLNKLGFLWVTLALFVISSAHWIFAWFSYLEEQKDRNQPIEISNYFNMTFRDTMENWQSEFLQLIWQYQVSHFFGILAHHNLFKLIITLSITLFYCLNTIYSLTEKELLRL